jgi:Protein of unknown function (DUF4240)
MDQSAFWRLIGKIDRAALRDGDDEGAVEPLVEALAGCGEADIREFENLLSQCLYDIDGQAYADQAGQSGQSGDGFLYARCYVVAKGRKHYDAVRADPTKMPKSLDEWCESLLYVAPQAWAAATGNDEEAWDHDTPVSYETGSNKANWP